ncbi:ribose-5-phosphate isomerase [Paenibacillus sophorae]|uniref:Ribose 5-phosphate isomerase A n=1 Tax=Paenibacillus sophorae TaxID=1333845 RepID=A0A1H8NP69_9BACL|nr:ribose 5-phosphate isomerase A [Paenibacillus sophorae]QWU14520.1 ribose 5-phosphate isomerase A [Paenibacillus sophorae]SEO31410.1 ribose-5-phosphate isomerase [Paenibacillus sophorae]
MSDDIKKVCAREALKLIKTGTIIGLGGGSTISYLIQYIKEDANLEVKVVTPSVKTRLLCIQNGLEVLYTSAVEQISVAFDGCDEVDESLNALKSGGGIHTKEKLIASMAEDYILLVDDTKFVSRLTFKHPVVLEILEDSLAYVQHKVAELGGKPSIRTSAAKDGFTVTENGNLLLDVHFEQVDDIAKLESELQQIRGVVDTSLFVNVATKALIAGESGVRLVSGTKN